MTVSTTSATPVPVRIDFVSDVSCPWCVVGLKSLEQALDKLQDTVQADIHFQPFELNANMPPEGEDIGEHIARKYGSTPEQMAQSREAIRARGEQLGFTFAMDKRGRIYNTFDAHRLLHWAALEGRQKELKMALFDAYFTQGQDPSSHEVLLAVAGKVGLDAVKAAAVLASNAYADEVRAQEQFYQQNGINSVPAVIINERHLISGGQPPEVFEQALRQIIAGA
ncbi:MULTISPECIES: DsbA family oxidoreductase [unclassified Janthinobacterium]|uniref:DsbA family oxidoreductase n=1 Tax=unclassified Janthinobacterium TaxID=2610881 RepID=UPI000C10A698|nr:MULTISPECIES: DsbA family oxidoreductase [unclassified Janthinobacterium]MDZ5632337.1 DsbA family oxidoreductase [Janthinobacterium sp. GMG1]PHV30084.1 disulfide bond formation protein DsbA [Janthinobacterium sp. BJB426]